jgi:hypothetical protein
VGVSPALPALHSKGDEIGGKRIEMHKNGRLPCNYLAGSPQTAEIYRSICVLCGKKINRRGGQEGK